MDKTVAGVIGVVTALAAAEPGMAAPLMREPVPQADSYKALLQPIPNALALLREEHAAARAPGGGDHPVQEAQYYPYPYGYPPPPPAYPPGYYGNPYWYYHHHHHHHRWWPRYYHHHHHHQFRRGW